MARPNKSRLDYFPLDVDIFDDEKVSAISGEFGYKGEIILIKLLCEIYKNGYYYEWDEKKKMILLSKLPGMTESLIDNVIDRLIKWNFFDKKIFDSYHVITSRNIQQVYFSATSRRKMVHKDLPYLLFDTGKNNEEKPKKTEVKENKKKSPDKSECEVRHSSCINDLYFKDGIERNYQGLIDRLKTLNVCDQNQVSEIIKLSHGGMIGHYVWEVLANFHKSSASAIKYPGLFIISKLKEHEKENINMGNEVN